MRIRYLFDPGYGMEKFGYGINIPDPQHWFIVNTVTPPPPLAGVTAHSCYLYDFDSPPPSTQG